MVGVRLAFLTAIFAFSLIFSSSVYAGSSSVVSSIKTNTNAGSTIIFEQNVVSQSNSSEVTVHEYKSENGKVVVDRTYTRDSDNVDLDGLEQELNKEIQEKVDKKLKSANLKAEQKIEESEQKSEQIEQELDKLEEEINQKVEERVGEIHEEQQSWWGQFTLWLRERLDSIGL